MVQGGGTSADCRHTNPQRKQGILHAAENDTFGTLHTNPHRKQGRRLRSLLALRVSVEAGRVQYKFIAGPCLRRGLVCRGVAWSWEVNYRMAWRAASSTRRWAAS